MANLLVTPLMFALRVGMILYDVVTFIPSCLIYRPKKRLENSRRVKALRVSDDSGGPWRSVDRLAQLTTEVLPGVTTLRELMKRAAQKNSHRPCLGSRPIISQSKEPHGKKTFIKVVLGDYEWTTYAEMHEQSANVGKGLLALGQKAGSNVCIFAETRAEWIMSAIGCFTCNFPVVTVYATLGEEALIHAINESDSTTVITTDELMSKFKENIKSMPEVRRIVYMGGHYTPKPDDFPDNVKILSFAALQEKGNHSGTELEKIEGPKPDDMALLMYTSGTTGKPKGVMMSHHNLLSAMSGMIPRIPDLGPSDTYIAFLPLAHVLEVVSELSCISRGVRIGYSSPQTLTDQSTRIKKGSQGDATVLKPTLLAAVPLIMDRIYKAVREKVDNSNALSKALFDLACEYKKDQLLRGFDTPILNWLVFGKIRQLVGGRVRIIMSGSAPLNEDTQRFMNVSLCCPVGQGYGLTETCGGGTIQEHTDLSTGRVGSPITCSQILLRDYKEGGYSTKSNPPRGEVLIGGGNVAMGYYNNEKKTNEDFATIDGVRYFCTGDIGEIHRDGCLKVIDRARDLVKLQAGEYVALNKVENALKMVSVVENICIYADSSKEYAIALVVPSKKKLKELAPSGEGDSWEELCKNSEVVDKVLKLLQSQAKESKLERFETPQKVHLCSEEWTVENDMVTDTFKLKRRNIKSHYEEEIKELYK